MEHLLNEISRTDPAKCGIDRLAATIIQHHLTGDIFPNILR
jgi:hypothetical protein